MNMAIMLKEVDEMLARDVIKHSNSPWASTVVFVKNKDGSRRFCVDVRRLTPYRRCLLSTEDRKDALADGQR